MPCANHFLDTLKCILLENAIHSVDSLCKIKLTYKQHVSHGASPLTFNQFVILLHSAADLHDSQCAAKCNVVPKWHEVCFHYVDPTCDDGAVPADDCDDNAPDFNVDTPLAELEVCLSKSAEELWLFSLLLEPKFPKNYILDCLLLQSKPGMTHPMT